MSVAFTLQMRMVAARCLRTAFLLCIGIQSSCLAADRVADSLIGSWRLVSYTDVVEGEAPIRAFGADPIGLFIFTADGHVSISIMRNPPDVGAPTTDPDPNACVPGWFCAYFGTYEVDYQASTWVTHVRGGNVPAYLGTDQKRHFSLRGDRLVISASGELGGKTVHHERVLVREPSR